MYKILVAVLENKDMKDQLHYDEWKDKTELFHNNNEGRTIQTQRINPYWQNPTKAQRVLYLYLKHKHNCREEPHESEIFEIYSEYVTPIGNQRFTNNPEGDDERIRSNARLWFRNSISALVFLGWFGLQFNRKATL